MVQADNPSHSESSSDSVSSARTALAEHRGCIEMLLDESMQSPNLEICVNGGFMLAPFLPFIILFCHIVESSDSSDLDSMQQVLDVLESLSEYPRHAACRRQFIILKALFNVVSKYVEVQASIQQEPQQHLQHPQQQEQQERSIDTAPFDLDVQAYLDDNPSARSGMTFPPQAFTAEGPTPTLERQQAAMDLGNGLVGQSAMRDGNTNTNTAFGFQQPATSSTMQSYLFNDFIMDLDSPETQLGNWFYQSQQMMRLLDDMPNSQDRNMG